MEFGDLPSLREMVQELSPEEVQELVDTLPPAMTHALLQELGEMGSGGPIANSPSEHAQNLYDNFSDELHLQHLSNRIAKAVKDVESGTSRHLIVQLPPRSGKTTLTTLTVPSWIMSRNPKWPIALTSHSGSLATEWGRQIRRWAESGKLGGVSLAKDAGAASSWETTEGGKLLSLSIRESFTGRGAKCLIIDDPHKDFVDAHSAVMRKNVWDWWLSVAQPRLEPPSLVIVVMTRWHEDDFVGRLLSEDHEGDPGIWEVISLPAVAEAGDALNRAPGQPLISPLISETSEEALQRWQDVRTSVGEYVWSAMYQQRPAPAKGSIFDVSWWRYWTTDPAKATEDGRIVYLEPDKDLVNARWLDSWDCAFKGTKTSDYVVGQRWARKGANRYLIGQQRGRWSFTQTMEKMKAWSKPYSTPDNPSGHLVHQRLIEEAANGAAIIDSLKDEISGIKPITARNSKDSRARSVTPEIESGNVYLPLPADQPWVNELISETRNFPNDAHDDQVDSLTQALSELRGSGPGVITVPGRSQRPVIREVTRTAARDLGITRRYSR